MVFCFLPIHLHSLISDLASERGLAPYSVHKSLCLSLEISQFTRQVMWQQAHPHVGIWPDAVSQGHSAFTGRV